MAYFITRVELHDSKSAEDYVRLHQAMDGQGFSRFINVGGQRQHLPMAEYLHGDTTTTQAVLDKAKSAVATVGKKAAILVSHVSDGTASGLTPA